MKNTIKNLFLVSLVVVGAFTTAISQSTKYITLAPAAFKAQQAKDNGFLMDLRTPEQYMEASIKHSKLCSMNDQNFEAILDMLDKNNPVYVYDQDGKSSVKAAEMMLKKGYTKVNILQGGLDAWKKVGLEIVNLKAAAK